MLSSPIDSHPAAWRIYDLRRTSFVRPSMPSDQPAPCGARPRCRLRAPAGAVRPRARSRRRAAPATASSGGTISTAPRAARCSARKRLLGLALVGKRHQHRRRAGGKDVEDGVVAGLADRNLAAPQQLRQIGPEALDDDAGRQLRGQRGELRRSGRLGPASRRQPASARQPRRRAASAAAQQRAADRTAAGRDQDLAGARASAAMAASSGGRVGCARHSRCRRAGRRLPAQAESSLRAGSDPGRHAPAPRRNRRARGRRSRARRSVVLGCDDDVAQRAQHQRARAAGAGRGDQRLELEAKGAAGERKRLDQHGIGLRPRQRRRAMPAAGAARSASSTGRPSPSTRFLKVASRARIGASWTIAAPPRRQAPAAARRPRPGSRRGPRAPAPRPDAARAADARCRADAGHRTGPSRSRGRRSRRDSSRLGGIGRPQRGDHRGKARAPPPADHARPRPRRRAASAKPRAQSRIGEQAAHRRGEGRGVARRHQQAGDPVRDDLADAAAGAGDDRQPARLGFEQRHAKGLVDRRPDAEIGRGETRGRSPPATERPGPADPRAERGERRARPRRGRHRRRRLRATSRDRAAAPAPRRARGRRRACRPAASSPPRSAGAACRLRAPRLASA